MQIIEYMLQGLQPPTLKETKLLYVLSHGPHYGLSHWLVTSHPQEEFSSFFFLKQLVFHVLFKYVSWSPQINNIKGLDSTLILLILRWKQFAMFPILVKYDFHNYIINKKQSVIILRNTFLPMYSPKFMPQAFAGYFPCHYSWLARYLGINRRGLIYN